MTGPPAGPGSSLREVGRFLEIQNLGLNLPFALAFLVAAARGWPPWLPVVLILVAFVAARNAGHSFNRWADRAYDARNPRTQERALVTGRLSARFALAFAAASGVVVVLAAYFLNPLAFALSPVALLLVYGYSYTKRATWATTTFLGLVEAATPAAIFIGLTGSLPLGALAAVGALVLWGTAFESVHSLGDVVADRRLGLRSLPARVGPKTAVRLLPVLHGGAMAFFVLFGLFEQFSYPYYVALAGMAGLLAALDARVARAPDRVLLPFRLHFLLGGIFLAGVFLAVFFPHVG